MTERRKIAKHIKAKRGAWVPAELEHPTARRARERIRKREGIVEEDVNNEPPLSDYQPSFDRSAWWNSQSPSSRRKIHTSSVSLGFGSSSKLGTHLQ